MRRTVTIDVLLPLLYLKGISTTDFADSFEPILGSKPKNLSPNVISRLKSEWYDQYLLWQRRDLTKKKYVYFWVDGIYLQARMESEKNYILVIIGVDEYGKKELVAIDDGFRESKESWQGLLLDIKSRGLIHSPALAVGDGALGFWGALAEEYPTTVHQRCWVHKTSNILNKLPKSQQAKAKQMIHNIYMASSREEAESSWKKFILAYSAKYPKATECLLKNEKELELLSCIEVVVSEEVAKDRVLGRNRGDDDKVEVFNNRMSVYIEPLKAIQDFYESKNILKKIDGERTIEEIVDEMESFILSKIV